MKLAILAICLLGLMMLECQSSPVQLVENYELASKARALGRQAASGDIAPAAAAAAPAASSDDDDDDDDEDDDDDGGIETLLGDDDDDDDDDEEDDDDDEDDTPQGQAAPGAAPAAAASAADDDDDDGDDYIDSIFDDILGDDDDDDDDDDEDEPSPAAAVAPVQPAPAVATPAQPAAVAAPAQPAAAEVLEEAASGVSEGENVIASGAEEAVEGEQNVFYDEENSGIDTKVDIQSLNVKPLESTTAKVAVAAPAVATNQVEASDDDDDDDEDDLTGGLTGIDDDEDDDDTDDDDDDEDDIDGSDIIEARRARGAEKNVIATPKDAFQERHNQFIDAIFARINRIVSDSYDPFKVRLTSLPSKQASTQTQKPSTPSKLTKTSTKSKTKKVSGGSKTRSIDAEANSATIIQSDTATPQEKPSSSTDAVVDASPSTMVEIKQKQKQQKQKPQTVSTESAEKRTVPSVSSSSTNSKNKKKIQPLRSNTSKQTTKQQKTKQTSSNLSTSPSPSASATAKPSVKSSASMEKLRGAVGSLSGLASLRRVGNAKVVTDPEGRNSTIKSKFTLGPLTLKVEKSFKRGNVRNVKTASARTNEMIGRIKFSVVNDQATLVSIKVQQPKQVEIESKDNHDRTREMVWRRTPKIARLVSEKLRLAAESLFQPQVGMQVDRV